MKNIIIDGFVTHFLINEKGEVLNTKTNNWLQGTIRDGYRYYDLRFNGKKKSKSSHRLVAEAFINNPANLPCVHHKDGNRLNNSVDNLQWVSFSENNLKINKQNCVSSDIDVIVTTDERWKNYLNTYYSVSTCGRVKNNKTQKILKGKITSGGYHEYCLTIHGKKISILAHRLIYSTFFPNEQLLTINHIDGNKLNNHLNNLENITQKENNLKALYDTRSKKIKNVGQYDAEGNLIQIFTSCAEAARYCKCRPQSINAAIHNNYCSSGYYWKYIEN